MAEYDAGEIFAQIVPSFRGVRQKIEAEAKQWASIIQNACEGALPAALREGARTAREQGARAGSDYGGSFAQLVRDRIEAAFRALPKARPGVDATELDAELEDIRARLAALRDVRVGVDLDAAAALAEIDRLHERLTVLGDRSPNIQVRVDAARALAELEAVQAAVNHLDHDTASVDVDTHGAESGLSGLLVTALALGPALIPIGAAATAGLAGIATVAASAAAGIGVIALAFNGVIGALQALQQEHQKSGTAARTSAAAQVSAANQVQSAEAALANTRQNADSAAIRSAEEVANARRHVADVQRQAAVDLASAAQRVVAAEQQAAAADLNSADAQERLNQAREQAARDLEDVANRAADASLNLRQAQLDLTDAQAQYAAVMASTSATEEQRSRAQLALDEATQRLTEAQQEAARSAVDNNAAQKAGVDGAPSVVAAARNVTAAQRAQQQAHRDVAAARRDEARQAQQSARDVADAQRGLSDAIRSQQDQARQSAYAVASAQRAVAQALQAQTAAAEPASAASDKAATALAALSPAGRNFVRFIENDLLPAFHGIRDVAQTNLFPGMERGIKAAMPLIGPFTHFVGGLASTLGHLFAEGGKALNSPFWRRFFGYVDATASPTLVIFAHILGNLARGFAGLMMAFAPVVTQVGLGLEHLTGHFAAFGEHASSSGSFGRFIDYVQRNGPLVVSTLGSLFRAFGHLLEAIAPLGTIALEVLRAVGNAISAIPTGVLGALASAIVAIVVAVKIWTIAQGILDAVLDANPIGLIVIALIGLAAALVYAWKHSETFRDIVHGVLHFIAASASSFWHDFLQPILHALDVAMHAVGDAATWLWRNAIEPAFHGIATGVRAYWDYYLHPVLSGAVSIFHAVGDAATWLWQHAIEPAWRAISGASSRLWGDITGFFVGGINNVIRLVNSFLSHITDVLGFFGIHKHWQIDLIGRQSIVGTVYSAGSQKPGFADGGVLPGYAPGVDSIVAMVSPGEAILRPEVTRWLGPDTIHGWNAAARRGNLPGFADGGIVGDSSSSGFFDHFGSAVIRVIRQAADAFIHSLGGVGHRILGSVLHGVGSLFHLGDTTAHGTDAASAQTVARKLLPRFGWDGAQMPALVSLWNHESGWNYQATNPSSGAYGIPQSLPGSKMASAGADWRTNPVTQIMWGLGYIHDRYGSPAGAWRHELAFNWYDEGGYLPPGASLVMNGTGRPEPVLTHQQLSQLAAGSDGVAAFEGDLYLDSGEFLGVVRGEAKQVVDQHDRRGQVLTRKGARR